MVRGVVMLIGLLSSAALGAPIVFCAPPELRKEVIATLKERGKTFIDLSELDGALFGVDGARARMAAGKPVSLKASLPKEVRADFDVGHAACRARADQSVEGRRACADQLASAVWQRHLERVGPELVLEFRPGEEMLELAIYRPAEATVSGRALPWELKPTVRGFVLEALEGPYPVLGSRTNSNVLPAANDGAPVRASLSDGAPQSLPAVAVRKGCTLPAELVVEPANVPLAVTISSLWRASAAGRVKEGAKPARCSLALGGDPPAAVNFTCGNELASLPIKARFGEQAFQAELAKLFVTGQVQAQCAAKP